MTDKGKTYLKAVAIVAVLLVVWWWFRKPKTVQQTASMSPWAAPFFQTNPGITDLTTWNIANPAPSFNATNTLNYQNGQIAGLSNEYFPMFGLVGMTAVGA